MNKYIVKNKKEIMKEYTNNKKLATVAITEVSEVRWSRLIELIAHSQNLDKLIPFLKGEAYGLSHYAEIDGRECASIKTNLYDVLINNRVDYKYNIEEYKTYYIKPSDFSPENNLIEQFNSKEKPDHRKEPMGDYLCPIVIPFKVEKRGICTFDEWKANTLEKGTAWRLER